MDITRIASAIGLSAFLALGAALPATAAGDDAAAPANVAPANVAGQAPADENFGPLGLSVLGIHNALVKTIARADTAGIDRIDHFESVRLIESSIHEWEGKYPHDLWLPKTVLALHRAYQQLAGSDAEAHAGDVAAWLLAKYPSSDEAQALRADLSGETAPAAPAVTVAEEPAGR